MKVLLTGGAGFIGSHVADLLLAREHEVVVVDDLSTGALDKVPGDALFCELDIRTGCEEVFKEFRPKALVHQAAQINLRRSVQEPGFDADVNVLGTLKLLENCVKYGVEKIIFASTGGAIYGEQSEYPATEDHPQYPLAPYGIAKLAVERYLHFYNIQRRIPYIALRYANVYGPRQDPRGEAGVVAIFCCNLTTGAHSTINGTGEQTRDYVFVGDVAQANVKALESNAPAGPYNVGTGVETSVNQLYETLEDAAGRYLPPEYGPAKPGEQVRSCIDPSKANRFLGWRPEVDLTIGLQKTLEHFNVDLQSEEVQI